MLEVDEILNLPADAVDRRETWLQIDKIVGKLNAEDQIHEWNRVVATVEAKGIPSGHPHFRLGVLHLVNDASEADGIRHLELAYEQDYLHDKSGEPHHRAAYRVLALAKDFFDYLKTDKTARPWQKAQLDAPYRKVLTHVLLAAYDETAKNILDLPRLTYSPFFKLMKDDRLRTFAGENYYCAEELLELVSLERGSQLRNLYQ